MAKDFISDKEMEALMTQGKAQKPDFITDAEADRFFGAPAQAAPQPAPAQGEKKEGFLKRLGKGLVKPLVTSGTRIGQVVSYGIGALAGNDRIKDAALRSASTEQQVDIPILGSYKVAPLKTGAAGYRQAAGEGIETASLALKNPITAGAASAFGSSLSRGDSAKDTAVNTAVGAGTGLLTKGAGKLISKAAPKAAGALDDSARQTMTKVLAPTTKANKLKTEKVVPRLLDKGVTALTRKGLQAKAAGMADDFGTRIDDAFDALPDSRKQDVLPILRTLQKGKESALVNGKVLDRQRYQAFDRIQQDILGLADGADAKRVPVRPVVSTKSLRGARQIFDKATKRQGVFAVTDKDAAVAEARKEAANAIRGELAKANPDIDALNKEFSFWQNVREVLGDTITRTAGQTSLTREMAADAGAVVASNINPSVGAAAAGYLGLKYLKQAVQSTAWRTVSAVTKHRIANFIASGSFKQADRLLQQVVNSYLRSRPSQ